jgi:glycosyltransferase involved in cell wall biosynthesis
LEKELQIEKSSVKIAQIAPLMESCPPRLYGGTERIVSYLTEELVRLGHDVTLFASGDSQTSAQLEPFCENALRLDPNIHDPTPHHIVMLDSVRARADEFDVLHFHVDVLHYPFIRDFMDRTVTTMHGRLDLPEERHVLSAFAEAPLVSISDDQRSSLPSANWVGTVYHGLPRDLLPFTPAPKGDYVAYLGRITPDKGPDCAIEIATRAGVKLKMAAKIDEVDRAYWETTIQPLVATHSNIEFVGEVADREKGVFLGNANALLFPIDWPEPFGLAMIEAMACGTPVIAFRRGSTPEVIDEGVSGFLVDGADEAVAAIRRVGEFDRLRVRRQFEQRFAIERVAAEYVNIYRRLPGITRPKRNGEATNQSFRFGAGINFEDRRLASNEVPLSALHGKAGSAEQAIWQKVAGELPPTRDDSE